jgi:hypothetical protein
MHYTPWPEPASELYRPSVRRLQATLVPTSADRCCHVVSVTNPYGRIHGILDRSHYFLFQVPRQLYSRGWVDPVPDPLLLRKAGSAGNRTRDLWVCNQELWTLDHRGCQQMHMSHKITHHAQTKHSTQNCINNKGQITVNTMQKKKSKAISITDRGGL